MVSPSGNYHVNTAHYRFLGVRYGTMSCVFLYDGEGRWRWGIVCVRVMSVREGAFRTVITGFSYFIDHVSVVYRERKRGAVKR